MVLGKDNISKSNSFRAEDLEALVSVPMELFPEQMMGCGELLHKYPHYFVDTMKKYNIIFSIIIFSYSTFIFSNFNQF